MDWLKMHAGNILKAAALVITIGGGSLTFFMDLKTDVAVLQADFKGMEQKIDILLRAFSRDDPAR